MAKIAFTLRNHPTLQIRRSAAVGMHSSIESWAHLKSSRATANWDRRHYQIASAEAGLTPIDHLTNVGRYSGSPEDDLLSSDNSGVVDSALLEYLQWVSEAVHTEADMQCRSILLDSMRIALEIIK